MKCSHVLWLERGVGPDLSQLTYTEQPGKEFLPIYFRIWAVTVK